MPFPAWLLSWVQTKAADEGWKRLRRAVQGDELERAVSTCGEMALAQVAKVVHPDDERLQAELHDALNETFEVAALVGGATSSSNLTDQLLAAVSHQLAEWAVPKTTGPAEAPVTYTEADQFGVDLADLSLELTLATVNTIRMMAMAEGGLEPLAQELRVDDLGARLERYLTEVADRLELGFNEVGGRLESRLSEAMQELKKEAAVMVLERQVSAPLAGTRTPLAALDSELRLPPVATEPPRLVLTEKNTVEGGLEAAERFVLEVADRLAHGAAGPLHTLEDKFFTMVRQRIEDLRSEPPEEVAGEVTTLLRVVTDQRDYLTQFAAANRLIVLARHEQLFLRRSGEESVYSSPRQQARSIIGLAWRTWAWNQHDDDFLHFVFPRDSDGRTWETFFLTASQAENLELEEGHAYPLERLFPSALHERALPSLARLVARQASAEAAMDELRLLSDLSRWVFSKQHPLDVKWFE